MLSRTRNSAFGAIRIAPFCLGLFAIGCGGGGGSSTNSTSSTETSQVGPVAVSFTGHPQVAVTASTGLVTSVGQAGASYTTLSMNPAHSLASTFIAFDRPYSSQGFKLYTVPATLNSTPSLLLNSGESAYPSISQSGVIAFWADYPNGVTAQGIFSALGDGSQFKPVFEGSEFESAISPNGATVAYVDELGDVWTVASSGGTSTEIYSGGDAAKEPPAWSPSSTVLAFTRVVGGLSQSWTMTSIRCITDEYYALRIRRWKHHGKFLVPRRQFPRLHLQSKWLTHQQCGHYFANFGEHLRGY